MDITYIPFMFPHIPNVCCAFQTRMGGNSQGDYGGGNISFSTEDDVATVAMNRQSLYQILGLSKVAEVNQIHSDIIYFEPSAVDFSTAPSIEGDGLATCDPTMGLMMKSADCQPILLAHNSGTYRAALHVGWKGNRINFIVTAVKKFCEQYSIEAKDVSAVRGPSLGPYASEFIHFDTEWGSDFENWHDANNNTVNLWELTKDQLKQAGLLAHNIYGIDLCTYTMHEQFFSFRRVAKSGRQASLIWYNSRY